MVSYIMYSARRRRPALAASDAAAAHVDGDLEKEGKTYRKGVAALAAANCAHFFSVCSIFPYAGFLAVDNGWAVDIDAAGYVAGWLATFTLIARIPTSTLWGLAADRWGSKICLEVSLLAIAIGSPLFGLSSALWAAIASRALFLGALNGWPTLTGLMVAEISGEERQGAALSQIISVGGFMGLIGPAVGGWTYDSVGFVPRALPPNLIASAICVVALGLVHVWYPSVGSGGRRTTAGDDGDTASNRSANAGPSASAEAAAADSGDAWHGASDASSSAPVSMWHALCTPPLPLVLVYRLLVGLYLYLIFDGTVGGSNDLIHPFPPSSSHDSSMKPWVRAARTGSFPSVLHRFVGCWRTGAGPCITRHAPRRVELPSTRLHDVLPGAPAAPPRHEARCARYHSAGPRARAAAGGTARTVSAPPPRGHDAP